MEDLVCGRRLVLAGEIGQRAAKQRHMRYTRNAVALSSSDDITQTLTLAPRGDFFPWIGMGQIYVRDLLRFFIFAQGFCEPGKQVTVVYPECATRKCRLSQAGKQKSLVAKKKRSAYAVGRTV
jgi:hypothetical protein